ncbi:MAG: hypothetical protein IIA83_06610, partial [Thaumarchaeota archaeon]|nr:hypothetical protein [Nitrososphaerota archaeon]
MEWANFQSLTFAGIVIEIIGFFLVLRLWGKIPTVDEYDVWKKANKNKKDLFRDENLVYFLKSNVFHTTEGSQRVIMYDQVPKKFKHYWNWKTKYPSISLVVFGLILQL